MVIGFTQSCQKIILTKKEFLTFFLCDSDDVCLSSLASLSGGRCVCESVTQVTLNLKVPIESNLEKF